nr:MAG TPA: hypothetical protein [Caudoviricetes sp.]
MYVCIYYLFLLSIISLCISLLSISFYVLIYISYISLCSFLCIFLALSYISTSSSI